jgi:hypothetical protein
MLARAQHPNTPEAEKETAYAMAARMQRQYQFDEQMLNAMLPPEQRTEPVVEDMQFSDPNSEWEDHCFKLLTALSSLGGCQVEQEGRGNAKVVGFPADVRFVEMLMNGAVLELLSRMEPKWDPNKTEDENVAFLYEAGVKWRDIAEQGDFPWPDGGRLIRAYRRQCKREGRQPINGIQRKEAYRYSFATGFVERIQERVNSIVADRASGDAERDANSAVSTEVVLADRTALVMAKFWEVAPWHKPLTDEERAEQRRRTQEWMEREEEKQRKALAEREAMLANMSDKERERFLRNEEKERAKQEREQQRRWAQYDREDEREARRKNDHVGRRAGERAAERVDLSGGRNSMSNNKKEIS